MLRFPQGEQEWEGFTTLAENPKIIGIDRRVFFLVLMFGYLVQMATPFLFALAITVGGLFAARYLCRVDPQIMSILIAIEAHPHEWYDYDTAPSPAGLGPFVKRDPEQLKPY